MTNLIIKTRNKNTFAEEAIQLLGASFVFYAGTYSIKAIFNGVQLDNLGTVGSMLFYIFWIYKLLLIMFRYLFCIRRIVLWEAIYFLILLVNWKLFPYTHEYYEEYYMFLRQIVVVFLPCGAILSQVKEYNHAFFYLKKYALFGSILMWIAFPLGYINYWEAQYWGVQLSPFTMIIFQNYLENHKIQDGIIFIINLVLVLAGGRQSFFIVVISCLMMYIYSNRYKSKKVLILIFLSISVGSFFVSGVFSIIIKGMNELLKNSGMEFRTIAELANGNFFDTSTRDLIYEKSVQIIEMNGPKISGLFSDRFYIRQYKQWIAYPHNLILEVLIDFGTVLGSLILGLIIFRVVFTILKGSSEKKLLCIMISSLVLCRLMVSSSFMIEGFC